MEAEKAAAEEEAEEEEEDEEDEEMLCGQILPTLSDSLNQTVR